MSRLLLIALVAGLAPFSFVGSAHADTFTHKKTGASFDGRLTGEQLGGLHKVMKPNGGIEYIDLKAYAVVKNDKGGPPKASYPWTGITVGRIELPRGCPGFPGKGITVHTMMTDSPAKRAGLKPGDIFLTVRDRPVRSYAGFETLFKREKPGVAVPLRMWRAAKEVKLELIPDNLHETTLVFQTTVLGAIKEGFADDFRETLGEAKANKAEVLVVEIDSPGGSVAEAIKASGALVRLKGVRTVAFVQRGDSGGAISAAALIALSCDDIYMQPGTTIGASTPYVIEEKTGNRKLDEKFMSDLRAQFRAVAQAKGHPALVAEGMVDLSLSIWVGEHKDGGLKFAQAASRTDAMQKCANKGERPLRVTQVSKKTQLVTLSVDQAVKWRVCRVKVKSLDDICVAMNIRKPRPVFTTVFKKAEAIEAEFKDALERVEADEDNYRDCRKSYDRLFRQLGNARRAEYYPPAAYRKLNLQLQGVVRSMVVSLKSRLSMARKFPELRLDVKEARTLLNHWTIELKALKKSRY